MSSALMYDVAVRYDRRALDEAEIRSQERIAALLAGADPETIKGYMDRVETLEDENQTLRNTVTSLHSSLQALEARVKNLEIGGSGAKPAAASAPAKKEESDDDDLFGSDSDEEEAKPAPKKLTVVKKAGPIAKSLIQLYVKPWDDETCMKTIEDNVRSIKMDGLVWGTSQLVPVGYGIKKLQIACVVEDEKVSVDDLENKITAFEDYVQSVDVASFNKI